MDSCIRRNLIHIRSLPTLSVYDVALTIVRPGDDGIRSLERVNAKRRHRPVKKETGMVHVRRAFHSTNLNPPASHILNRQVCHGVIRIGIYRNAVVLRYLLIPENGDELLRAGIGLYANCLARIWGTCGISSDHSNSEIPGFVPRDLELWRTETIPQNINPEFADMLGVSSSLMETWGQVRMQHAKANEYYSGYVFQKRVEIENGDPTDAPLLYPVTVNLIKMLVTAMSDAELGEFEEGDTPIIFQSPQSEEPDENAKALSSYCNGMMKEKDRKSVV